MARFSFMNVGGLRTKLPPVFFGFFAPPLTVLRQAAANNADSLFDEERFELIMEKESPMWAHIESGGTFAPMGL